MLCWRFAVLVDDGGVLGGDVVGRQVQGVWGGGMVGGSMVLYCGTLFFFLSTVVLQVTCDMPHATCHV